MKDNPSSGGVGMDTLTGHPDVIKLPIAQGEWALLQAAFPMTQAKWEQMLKVLEAMKPALITETNGQEKQGATSEIERGDT